jgi:hypothetical protein
MGVWEGVATDFPKFHLGQPCLTLLRPVGGRLPKRPYGLMASLPYGLMASWPYGLMALWPHGIMTFFNSVTSTGRHF